MANKKGVVAVLNINSLKRKFDVAGSLDITPAVKYGTQVVQQSARRNVRKKTRTLERSIDQRITNTPNGVQGEVFTNVEYAPPLEFGVNHSYEIKPKSAKALRFYVGGVAIFVKKIVMPPRKPYPFMKPALDDNKAVIRNTITSFYKANLAKLRK